MGKVFFSAVATAIALISISPTQAYNPTEVLTTQAYNPTEVLTTQALTQSGNQIIVENSDVDDVREASGDYLASLFQITKFLGTMALIAGGFMVFRTLMGILPGGGGGSK